MRCKSLPMTASGFIMFRGHNGFKTLVPAGGYVHGSVP